VPSRVPRGTHGFIVFVGFISFSSPNADSSHAGCVTFRAKNPGTPADNLNWRAGLRERPEEAPLLLLVGLGGLGGLGRERDVAAPLLTPSAEWESATPFVVTRYPKRRGTKRDRPEDHATPRAFARRVLRQELERRADLPPIVSIDDSDWIGPHRLRAIQFKRFRSKPGDDGGRRPAGGFRITFAEPIRGPLCLGHSCHFGLGLFVPAPSPTDFRAATC
jgi:CRISPR-associated protein Csb2